MSRGIPGLTPEQFQQVAAHARENGAGLRMAAVTLGFMSLDQLRTIRAQEEAEMSAQLPAHRFFADPAPSLAQDSASQQPSAAGADHTPRAALAAAPAQGARQAYADQASACAESVVALFKMAHGLDARPSAAGKARATEALIAVKSSPAPADRLSAQRVTAESVVALFNATNGATHAATNGLVPATRTPGPVLAPPRAERQAYADQARAYAEKIVAAFQLSGLDSNTDAE